MSTQLYKVTNYEDGEIYYFCQKSCAEAFDPWDGDWGDPEELTGVDLEEALENDYGCEFCQQKLKRE